MSNVGRPVRALGLRAAPEAEVVPILPSMPGVVPYDPPFLPDGAPAPSQEPDIQGVVPGSYEAYSSTPPFQWPWPGGDGSAPPDGAIGALVYRTKSFWKALDVYFSTPPPTPGGPPFDPLSGGVLSIFVYALTLAGDRVLVSSGRFRSTQALAAATAFFSIPQHICTVRQSLAQQYEVRVAMGLTAPGVKAQPLTVTVVASDDTTDKDESVGVVTAQPLIGASAFVVNAAAPFIPLPELVGIEAVNAAAAPAPRFLLYWDFAGAPGAVPPVFAWPLGDQAGDGYVNDKIRRRSFAFAIRASSTPGTLTAVADCNIQALIR